MQNWFKRNSSLLLILIVIILFILLAWLYTLNRTVLRVDLPIDYDAFSSFASMLSGVVTAITLILVYVQLKEMQEQANLSVRPEIALLPTVGTKTDGIFVDIINIGTGPAKNIKFEWVYDVVALRKSIERMKSRKSCNEGEAIFLEKIIAEGLDWGKSGMVPYVLADTKESFSIQLPNAVETYFMDNIDYNLVKPENYIEFNNVILKMDYIDIKGNRYSQDFEISARVVTGINITLYAYMPENSAPSFSIRTRYYEKGRLRSIKPNELGIEPE